MIIIDTTALLYSISSYCTDGHRNKLFITVISLWYQDQIGIKLGKTC